MLTINKYNKYYNSDIVHFNHNGYTLYKRTSFSGIYYVHHDSRLNDNQHKSLLTSYY